MRKSSFLRFLVCWTTSRRALVRYRADVVLRTHTVGKVDEVETLRCRDILQALEPESCCTACESS